LHQLNKNISNRRILGVLLFLLILTCGISSPVEIYSQTGNIEGTVIDNSNGGVVSNAIIKIESGTTGKTFNTFSDITGRFIFMNVSAAEYTITVTRLGYKEETSNITVTGNKTVTLTLPMTPIDIEIDKINVTATKTELTLKQTPSSISIVTSEEINNRNPLTFDEILSDVQGVTVFKTSGINVQSLSIRGSSDVAGGGIGNRVLLLLDGRPSLTGDSKGALWSLIPISIIDRTEVVKGAFSSLYGSSAIGGVVNVITKKPTYKSFFSVNANYGFYQPLNDSLKFTDKLLSFKGIDLIHSNTYKKLAYLVNLNYKKNDGHAQQTDYEFYSGLAKLMYDVVNNRDLEVTLQYTKSNGAFPHYWRKDPGGYSEPYKTSPIYLGDRIKKETQSLDVFYTALPSSKIKYTSRFYYYNLYSLSYFNPNNFVAQQYAPPGEALETTIKSYNFGNISQIDYNISNRNYFITGIDLQWNVVRSNPESILYGNQQMNNYGVFAQDQHKLIVDKAGNTILSTTAGVRLDYNQFVGLSKFLQVSPKLSFLYSPEIKRGAFSNIAFRFLVGRAFRAPSIAELYFKKELFGGFDFIFNPDLKPEEMISAEIGFRKQYDKRFTLDVSAYINEYDNLIQYVNVAGGIFGPFQVQNIAKAQIKGLEFLIDYNSTAFKKQLGYGFSFNYSLIDAKDLSQNRKDDFLPYKPMHIINFSTDLGYSGFHFNLNGKYVSKVDEDLFYRYEEPDEYFLLDMKLSKKLFDKATIFVAVNNLLNASYQELERTQAPNRSFNSGVRIEF
jgi:outer membrane receptor protein involved in Fe transport